MGIARKIVAKRRKIVAEARKIVAEARKIVANVNSFVTDNAKEVPLNRYLLWLVIVPVLFFWKGPRVAMAPATLQGFNLAFIYIID